MAGIPEWLFDESYDVVGDLAETVALVLPPAARSVETPLHVWMQERLIALRGQDPETIAAALRGWWDELDAAGRFLLTKLIGGSFRVGVARNLVVRALAQAVGLDAKVLAERMMGYTDKQHVPDAADIAARRTIEPLGSHRRECHEGRRLDHLAIERRQIVRYLGHGCLRQPASVDRCEFLYRFNDFHDRPAAFRRGGL